MFKLLKLFRSPITQQIPRNTARLLHVGDADVLSSSIDKNSVEFKVIIKQVEYLYYVLYNKQLQENVVEMTNLVNQLDDITRQILTGGGTTAIERHTSRGKLLPRERINLLLDKGSSFLELSTLAGYELYGKDIVNSGGIVTGVGRICGYVLVIDAYKFNEYLKNICTLLQN